MFGAGMDDWDGEEIIRVPADRMEFTFNLLAPFLPFLGGGKTLRNAPPIISESMTFPYFKGMVFCTKIANARGLGGDRRGLHEPSALDRADPSPGKIPRETRLSDGDRPGRAQARRRLEGGGPKRPGRDATGHHAQEARRQQGRRRLGRRPIRRIRGPARTSSGWYGFQPGTAKTTPGSLLTGTSAIKPQKSAAWASLPSRFPTRSGETGTTAFTSCRGADAMSRWSRDSRPRQRPGWWKPHSGPSRPRCKPEAEKGDSRQARLPRRSPDLVK